MSSSPSDPPPAKKHSEYAHISEIAEVLNKEHDQSGVSEKSLQLEDDNVSVAGTVFNEPWVGIC